MIMSDALAAEMLLRVSDQHRLHWQWTQNITGPSREYHAFHSPQNLRPPGRLPPPGDPDSPAFRAELEWGNCSPGTSQPDKVFR